MTKPNDDTLAVKIRLHYKRAGVFPGWPDWRFVRLCKLLGMTAEELGWMCAITPADVRRFMKAKSFAPAASLHFAMIEAAFLEAKCGKKSHVMPLNLLNEKSKNTPSAESSHGPHCGDAYGSEPSGRLPAGSP